MLQRSTNITICNRLPWDFGLFWLILSNKNIILFNKWGISEYDLLYLGLFRGITLPEGERGGRSMGRGYPSPYPKGQKSLRDLHAKGDAEAKKKQRLNPANRTVWLGDYKPTVDIGFKCKEGWRGENWGRKGAKMSTVGAILGYC